MENTKIHLIMSVKRAEFLLKALEVVARAGIGQFRYLIELINPQMSQDDVLLFEKELVSAFKTSFEGVDLAGGKGDDEYYALHDKRVPEECRVAMEAFDHLRRELAWLFHGKNWRTDLRDWETMQALEFDDPLKISNAPGEFIITIDKTSGSVANKVLINENQ